MCCIKLERHQDVVVDRASLGPLWELSAIPQILVQYSEIQK